MSAYSSLGTSEQTKISEQLYKGLVGYPTGKVEASLDQEVAGTSRNNIFKNQVFAQDIPLQEPTDMILDNSGVIIGTTQFSGERYYSVSKPYIVKYVKIRLDSSQLTPGKTYWFIGANTTYSATANLQITNNLLNKGIPANYSPKLYQISVTITVGGSTGDYGFGNSSYPWLYNPNSGILSFLQGSKAALTLTDTVDITFWRYEGNMGIPLPTESLSLTSSAGGIEQPIIMIKTTNPDVSGAYLNIVKETSSAAVNDDVGGITFYASDTLSGTNLVKYGSINTIISDPTTANQNGIMNLNVTIDGADTTLLNLDGSNNKVTINSALDLSGQLNMKTYKIINLANAVNPSDAVTKSQLDASIGNTISQSYVDTRDVLYDASITGYVNTNFLNKKTLTTQDVSGSINLASGKTYQIAGLDVITATGLGSAVIGSSLTSVGALTGLTMAGPITLAANKITTTATAFNTGELVSRDYVDGSLNSYLKLSGATSNINMGAYKVTTTATAFNTGELVSRDYVDGSLNSYLKLAGGTMTGDITLELRKITTTATAFNTGELVSRDYVDGSLNTKLTAYDASAGISYLNKKTLTTQDISGSINLASGKTYQIAGLDVISATGLGTAVTSSSLTSVGALTGLTMAGPITLAANKVTTTATAFNTNELVSRTYVDGSLNSYLKLSGVTSNINMGAYKITTTATAFNTGELVPRTYVDGSLNSYLKLSGGTMTGDITLELRKITTTATAFNTNELVPRTYVDGSLNSYLKLSGGTMTGTITMNSSAADIDLSGSNIVQKIGTDNIQFGSSATYALLNGGSNNVIVGRNTGASITTGSSNICVGNGAGATLTTGSSNVYLGNNAGSSSTTTQSGIGIGLNAGASSQGNYAIAIGSDAAPTSQHQNSIVINAAGVALNTDASNAFYVKPVRNNSVITNFMHYNTTNSEVKYALASSANLSVNNVTVASQGTGLNDVATKSYVDGLTSSVNEIIEYPNTLLTTLSPTTSVTLFLDSNVNVNYNLPNASGSYAFTKTLINQIDKSASDFVYGYSELGTGLSNLGTAVALDSNNNLYAGGTFTTAGGNSANRIAKWNGLAWSALGTGLNSQCLAIAIDSSNNLYAGGWFTLAGGVANTAYIAKWNGSAWSALGTGLNSSCNAIAIDRSNNLYAGGSFTTAGDVSANYIAKWDITTSTWSALGTGLNNYILSLVVDSSNNLYAGGWFTSAGGVINTAYIAKWNGITWSALGTGLGNNCYLAIDSSNNVYATGQFTTAGGNPANRIAKWNGTTWSALGTGINNPGTAIAVDSSNNVYVVGMFTTAGGNPANRIAKWNVATSIWSALGSGLTNTCQSIAIDSKSYYAYIGGSFLNAGDISANYITRYGYYSSTPTITGSFYLPNTSTSITSIKVSNVTQIKWSNNKWYITNVNELQNNYPPIYAMVYSNNAWTTTFREFIPLSMNLELIDGVLNPINPGSTTAGNIYTCQIRCDANVLYSGICFVLNGNSTGGVASMGIFSRDGRTRYAVTGDFNGDTPGTGVIRAKYVPFISPWLCTKNNTYIVTFYSKTNSWPIVISAGTTYQTIWGQINNLNGWDRIMASYSMGTGNIHPTTLSSLTANTWNTAASGPILYALV